MSDMQGRLIDAAKFIPASMEPPDAWIGHLPFANWLIKLFIPATFIELGTHSGNSYFSFCQAVSQEGLSTKCYAVDTWEGEEHAGYYGEEVFHQVNTHNQEHYADFSRLLRTTFDKAASYFSDGAIDLLHIDGLHTYEAVKHDFETWLPKLAPGAVVLFHDTNVRERGFGVWKLWDELQDLYPNNLEFIHSHGLGILQLDGGPEEKRLEWLKASSPMQKTLKDYFSALGMRQLDRFELHQLRDRIFSLNQAVTERDGQIASLKQAVTERDGQIASLKQAVTERDGQIASLKQAVAERDGQTASLKLAVAERDGQTASLKQGVTERDGQIAGLKLEAAEHAVQISNLQETIQAIHQSTSWRVTTPVRRVGRNWRTLKDLQTIVSRLLRHESLPVLSKRTLRVIRNEGLRGLKARIRQQHYMATQVSVIDAPDMYDDAEPLRMTPPAEAARPLEIDYSVSVPFSFAEIPNSKCGKVAAIIHLYYEDLAVEFRSYLSNVPVDLDVYISTTDAFKAVAIECVFSGWNKGSVEVRVVPNRGRDIAPKLVSFSDVYGHYDYILFIHGKRSDHASVLSHWRHFLLDTLLGTPQVVTSVLYAFEQNPNLGIIAAQHFEPMRHWVNWGDNFPIAQKLAAMMGFVLKELDPLDFPSGSMFWARSLALKPLLDLGLKTEDFDIEMHQLDATLAHAIERIFFHACEHGGFNWIKIARPELHEHTPKIVNVQRKMDLSTFFNRCIFRLLDPRGVKPRSVMPNPITKSAPQLINHIRNQALGMHIDVNPDTRVAIGLVTYNNSENELAGSIAAAEISLKSAGLNTEGALFLIDNGASTKNHISETGFITRLETRGNLGFGGGHNNLMHAAFKAGYDIYITINPDGLLHPEAVEALVQAVQAAHGKVLVEALQYPVEHPKPYDTQTLDTPWVSGACMAISRQAFDDLGWFDEDFFMFCEDVDLSWRARAHGYALKTCPRALFLHAVTNREMTPATLQMYFESGIILARKWGSLEFENWLKGELTAIGKPAPNHFPEIVPEEWRHVADFSHQFSFAQARW